MTDLHTDAAGASFTIDHNPGCGTSRNTLALICNSGVEPEVVENLKTPPGRARLVALIAAMVQHPILMNRPIVVTPLGTRLCRPSEAVLEILPTPHPAPFSKEDGEPLVDAVTLERSRRVSS